MHLFWRHVLGRAEDAARCWSTSRGSTGKTLADYFCQTKVTDLDEIVAGNGAALFLFSLHDENVGGLQIAMEDAFVMRGFNAGARLAQQHQGALHRNGSFTTEQLIQRLAFDVFHHEKENTFLAFAEISHADHVRVLHGSRGAGLAFKARDGFTFLQVFVREHIRPNSFDGHAPRDEVFVAREIHLAHGAAAQTLLQTIPSVL